MSIYAFTGVPGSGKSLDLARRIRASLGMKKRPVIGNFELSTSAPVRHPELYTYLPNEQLTPQKLIEFADEWWTAHDDQWHEGGLLLVVDEAQLLWNSRTWDSGRTARGAMSYAETDRMAWLQFFSQHRKLGYDVIMCCQAETMVDKQIRDNIEYLCLHRKLAKFGTWGFLVSLLFAGRLFLTITSYYGTGEILDRELWVNSRKDFRMYDTRKRYQHVDM